jgi:hypothetical protein
MIISMNYGDLYVNFYGLGLTSIGTKGPNPVDSDDQREGPS